MQLWEAIKKVTDKGYVLSIDSGCRIDGLLSDFVSIRLSDTHSPMHTMMNVELRRGVSDDGKFIYYDPNDAITLAIAYMLDKIEKGVKK